MEADTERSPRSKLKEKKLEELTPILWDYLRVEDDPEPADAIFIFGGDRLEVVDKAHELYEKGYAPKIFACSEGGKFGGEMVWDMPELEKYQEVLLEKGVSPQDIIIEPEKGKRTRNTFSESKRAIPLMKENKVDPKKVIVISRPPHARRSSTTIKKLWPDVIFIRCPSDEPFDPSNQATAARLVKEIERLHKFRDDRTGEGKKIPWKIQEAAAAIRKYHLKPEGAYTKD